LGRFDTFDGTSLDHIELSMANMAGLPTPLFNKETDWDGYVSDPHRVAWMSVMSMGVDVIMAIMRFIPEVVGTLASGPTPLEMFYDTVLECFYSLVGRLVAIPKLRNKAHLSAKAPLHLAIQCKCIGHEIDKAVFKVISNRNPIMGSTYHEGDSGLESTLGITDRVFSDLEPTSGRTSP